MTDETIKTIAETIKAFAEILALLAAGLYFGYRLISGYFVTNLSLSAIPSRHRSLTIGKDLLAITVKLTKGDRGSLSLHDAQVKVTWQGGEKIKSLIGVDRRHFILKKLGSVDWKVIDFKKRAETVPFLRLTPGEETTFSCYIEVPSGLVCDIEVAILGERSSSHRTGQWRASAISLPLR